MATETRALGEARHRHHRGSRTNRPIIEGNDPIGVAGELIFARKFGLPEDPTKRIGADRGWDFVAEDGRTIDVKATAYKGKTGDTGDPSMRVGLFADKGQVVADVYVLVYVDDVDKAAGRILGWATKDEMLAAPLRSTRKPGVDYALEGHWLHRSKLRGITSLVVQSPRTAPNRQPNGEIKRTVGTILGRECQISTTVDGGMAHVAFSDAGEALGAIVYRAEPKLGSPVFYVLSPAEGVGYGTMGDALAAAVRHAAITRERTPAPTSPESHSQPGLDF